jgi:hypothetical protein
VFGDDWLQYELEGRPQRVLQRPGEPLTADRVALFDRVRYLGPPPPDPTAMEAQEGGVGRLLLHRLPAGLGRLLLETAGSPCRVDQQRLLRCLVDHPAISYDRDDDGQGEGEGEQGQGAGGDLSEGEEDSELYHFPSI